MAMAEADSVVAELEGTLLKDQDPFPYFMLLALEASGLVRFALLLLLYPLLLLFRAAGRGDLALRLMVFAAAAGAREAEIAAAARAVLPRFYMDDVDAEAWRVFASCGKRVVVTALPRVMVAWFAREHLGAGVVVGAELVITRHGRATGLLIRQEDSVADRVQALFEAGHRPGVGLGRPNPAPSFLSLCKEQRHPPFTACSNLHSNQPTPPPPVIFHDGRLVRRPTPATALLTLLWMPFGVLLALVRMAVGVVVLVPVWNMPYLIPVFGGKLVVRGRPPPPATTGVLFVCTHRTLMDPLAITVALGRRVTAVTYSISRLSELLSPIRTVRLSRTREVDAGRIAAELARGDLVLCPEGTTCREPFLLRFSMLFAELTDRIVPVAIDYKVGFFHPTTATGWKAMDPLFFFMNPTPAYEVTFLSQLPEEATCSAGRSPIDVANYVQRVLAAALGFECTNYTRRDKYRILAGNDGSLSS